MNNTHLGRMPFITEDTTTEEIREAISHIHAAKEAGILSEKQAYKAAAKLAAQLLSPETQAYLASIPTQIERDALDREYNHRILQTAFSNAQEKFMEMRQEEQSFLLAEMATQEAA